MPVEFICDGCGERKPAVHNINGDTLKPWKWYSRVKTNPKDKNDKVRLYACSRKCTEKLGGLHAPW